MIAFYYNDYEIKLNLVCYMLLYVLTHLYFNLKIRSQTEMKYK